MDRVGQIAGGTVAEGPASVGDIPAGKIGEGHRKGGIPTVGLAEKSATAGAATLTREFLVMVSV
ncbi:MAG: hypothetical protein AB1568_06185 [Thermodesulfobacteriota bacterium]